MRTKGRIDTNQPEIVKGLRQIPGVSVWSTAALGNGFPDLVVGYKGVNYLMEIKDGGKVLSAQKLTISEKRWHKGWFGQVAIVRSLDDALKTIGVV